jgi:hypothetical protein
MRKQLQLQRLVNIHVHTHIYIRTRIVTLFTHIRSGVNVFMREQLQLQRLVWRRRWVAATQTAMATSTPLSTLANLLAEARAR